MNDIMMTMTCNGTGISKGKGDRKRKFIKNIILTSRHYSVTIIKQFLHVEVRNIEKLKDDQIGEKYAKKVEKFQEKLRKDGYVITLDRFRITFAIGVSLSTSTPQEDEGKQFKDFSISLNEVKLNKK